MRTLTDNEYAEFAKGDRDWVQTVASARIEGIALDPRDEVLAGRYLKGHITQSQWGETISEQQGYAVVVQRGKTEDWLRRTAPLIHQMSHDEAYRLSVAARLS